MLFWLFEFLFERKPHSFYKYEENIEWIGDVC